MIKPRLAKAINPICTIGRTDRDPISGCIIEAVGDTVGDKIGDGNNDTVGDKIGDGNNSAGGADVGT